MVDKGLNFASMLTQRVAIRFEEALRGGDRGEHVYSDVMGLAASRRMKPMLAKAIALPRQQEVSDFCYHTSILRAAMIPSLLAPCTSDLEPAGPRAGFEGEQQCNAPP